MSSAGKKLGRAILSPPFLKGDLGGLSGGYLIPPAPFKKKGVILSPLILPRLIQDYAAIRF
jgi:hypothetical protein